MSNLTKAFIFFIFIVILFMILSFIIVFINKERIREIINEAEKIRNLSIERENLMKIFLKEKLK